MMKRHCVFTIILLAICSVIAKSESINEMFIRMKYENLYDFDKKFTKTEQDSILYISNLSYITCNYCDSTTVSFHKDLIDRIHKVYPFIQGNLPVFNKVDNKLFLNNIHQELLVGLTKIYIAEDRLVSFTNDDLIKIYEVASYLIYTLFPFFDEEEKDIYISLALAFYANEETPKILTTEWLKYIDLMENNREYSSHSELIQNISYFLTENGEHENALLLAEALNSKCEKLYNTISKENLKSLSYLGAIYFNLNEYEKTFDNIQMRLGIKDKLGIPDIEVLNLYRDASYCLFTMGNYKEALRYGEKVLSLNDESDSLIITYDLERVAFCKFYLGQEDEALKIMEQVTDWRKENNCEKLVLYYSNISTMFRMNGDMINALKYGNLSLKEWEKKPTDNYDQLMSVFSSLVNIGACYYKLNDIPSSYAALIKALPIFKNLQEIRKYDKPRTEIQINAWGLLASIFMSTGQLEESKVFIDKAIELAKEYYGQENIRFLRTYSLLAEHKALSNDPQGELEIYLYILDSIRQEGKYYFEILRSYASCCIGIKKYEEAYSIISKFDANSNSIEDKILLARCEYYLGKYDELKEHLKLIYEQNIHEINNAFLTFNEIQRRTFWSGVNRGEWFKNELPNMIVQAKIYDDDILRLLYDATVFNKGIILSTNKDISNIIKSSNNPNLIKKYNKYIQLIKNRESNDTIQDASFFNDISKLEGELMDFVRANSDNISALNINSKVIQQHIESSSICIEFICIENDSTQIKTYYALVLEKDIEKAPSLVYLFDSEMLNKINPRRYYTSKALAELIWTPLKKYIHDKETVYFSPIGELNNIAIEYLPSIWGAGYLNENCNFIRVSNTREIVLKDKRALIDNVASFGGMIYDADLLSIEDYNPELLDNNYPKNENLWMNRSGHTYLPGSKIEVELVDSILKGYNVQSFTNIGLNGTEGLFKAVCTDPSPKIIHVSTHGIYYSKDEINTSINHQHLSFLKTSLHDNVYTEDLAMTQSVLLFSGSDAVFNGLKVPEGYEDGVLTAQEISFLDLHNTDLVVLSACQTGLGEIKGDGVYGLQRGFKKAGVKSIMMSLWDVDDDATQLLMTNFYTNLINGQSKQMALRNAQKAVREFDGEINGKHRDFSNPRYWAAFILLDALN